MHLIALLRRFFGAIALIALACPLSASAQVADKAALVPVHFQALFNAVNSGGPDQAYVKVTPLGITGASQAAIGSSLGGNGELSQGGFARLRPGRTYVFKLETHYVHRVEVKVTPPAGHRVIINDEAHEMFGWDRPASDPMTTVAYFDVRLDDGAAADVGEAASLRPGRVLWSVGLGNLRNGKPAGSLRLAEDGLTAAAFAPDALYFDHDTGRDNGSYAGADGEVIVVKVNYVLRQVYATTVLADIVPNAANTPQSYYIRLYPRTQVGSADSQGVYAVSGTPLFEFFIENPAVDAMRITKTVNQNGQRVTWTQMTKQTGQPTGTTQWLVHDWVEKGGATVVDSPVRHRWTYTNTDHNELLEVMDAAGTIAQSVFKQYTDLFFEVEMGRELTAVTTGYNGSAPITTNYTYYGAFGTGGSWRKIATISSNDGSWTGFSYSNDFRSQGRLLQVRRPYKNAPITDPGANPTTGESTTYTYDFVDFFGTKILPTKVETRIDNMVVARSEIAYAYESLTDTSAGYTAGHAVMPLTVATRKDYTSDTAYLTTTTRTYREDADWDHRFFRGLPYSIERPDKTMTVMAYFRANFLPLDPFSPIAPTPPVPGVPLGGARVHVALHGTSDTSIGAAMTAYPAAQPLPSEFRIVVGKSTQSRVLFNSDALPGISEQRAYVGANNWVVTHQNWLSYVNGIWPSVSSRRSGESGGFTTASQTWTGGRLTATVDETGIRHFFTPDSVGRVQTVLREGANGEGVTIANQTTNHTYDAMGRLRTQTMSAGAESLVHAIDYDTAGRVTSRSAPGQGTTALAYNVAQRTVTATLPPNAATVVETRLADGQIASITGTGTVAKHYEYEVPVLGSGRRKVTVRAATSNDVRRRETWLDWLGRPVEVRQPGFNGAQDFVETLVYGTRGHLEIRSRTGYADLRYQYNGMGQLFRQGLDLNGNGLETASSDRITDFDTVIESHDGAYWLTSRTWAYHKHGTADTVLLGVTRERLTGLSPTLRGETREQDAETNESRQTITTDGGKKVTITSTRPGMANAAIETTLNGLPIYAKGFDGLEYRQTYDALGRLYAVKDPRTGTASDGTYAYVPNTRLPYQQRDASNRIVATMIYDAAGRIIFVQNADSRTSRTDYTLRGEVAHRWGSATYPVAFAYNDYGELTGQSTYRDPGNSVGNLWETQTWPGQGVTAATTQWEYDAGSGLLKKKLYPGGQATQYTYNTRGQTAVRTWARNVTSTYDYFSGTGELRTIVYNDGTPTVSYEAAAGAGESYTRLGQPQFVSESVTGQRQFEYDQAAPWRLTSENLPAFYNSRKLASVFEDATSSGPDVGGYTGHVLSTVKGRYAGYRFGSAPTASTYDLEVVHGVNNAGREAGLISRRANGTVSRQFVYGYEPLAPLVKSLSVVSNAFQVTRTYSGNRDLVERIETKWSGTVKAAYDYTYNDLEQRRTSVQTGEAFADLGPTHQRFTYNSRGELQTAYTHPGADPESTGEVLAGRVHQYDYDWTGNRKTSNASGNSTIADDYVVNDLNQYTQRENTTLAVSGTAHSLARVAVTTTAAPPDGQRLALRPSNGTFWGENLLVNNQSGPFVGDIKAYAVLSGAGSGGGDLFSIQTKSGWLPPLLQTFTYDADGNLIGDGMWDYVWDAENRLVRMTTTDVAASAGRPRLKLKFAYDYLGRRVKKEVLSIAPLPSTTETLTSERRYVYDGWNVIAEYAVTGGSTLALARSFTWGLDLAGSRSATGGVGALVQLHDYEVNKTMFPAYDGNGNVIALINASSGAVEASYEYSPFGEVLRATGAYAVANPFRFSTKWQDEETGLLYYGYRYYSPREGRFINRDLIEEAGGLNLYGFGGNDGINGIDLLGMVLVGGTDRAPGRITLNGHEYEINADGSVDRIVDGKKKRVYGGGTDEDNQRAGPLADGFVFFDLDFGNDFTIGSTTEQSDTGGSAPNSGEYGAGDGPPIFNADRDAAEFARTRMRELERQLAWEYYGMLREYGREVGNKEIARAGAFGMLGLWKQTPEFMLADFLVGLGAGSAGAVERSVASKIVAAGATDVLDPLVARQLGIIIADNSVGAATYRQMQKAGVDLTLDFKNAPGAANVVKAGEGGADGATVFMRNHGSAKEAASTAVHEGRHAVMAARGINQGTQWAEFMARAREFMFNAGRVPTAVERAQIWQEMLKYPEYQNLPFR